MSKKDPIHTYGFGRVPIEDERDRNYPMRAVLPDDEVKTAKKDSKYQYWWQGAWWGDQGYTPRCVSFAWNHWLEDGPVTHFYEERDADPEWMDPDGDSLVDPTWLYEEAQKIDRWPGQDYRGTSVRAGAKFLQKQGLIEEYRWAWDAQPVVDAVLTKGPVVVGTRWYRDMYEPDSDNIIEKSGEMVGGHAYLLNGVNIEKGLFRIKNSWGPAWGKNGYAYISIEDMDELIREGGEACLAIENRYDSFG